ncbi:Orotate phosphoribosyltransferase [bacterium HR21]|nr:Orotate phosphoribosyltransferase [bacterium HR21]
MERAELARELFRVAYRRGDFQLRSGHRSHEYVDKYQFEAVPQLLQALGQELARLLPAETEVLAGMELGGIPLAVATAFASGLPCVFVRKEPKPYGTRRQTEGTDVTGRRVVLLEDVVTTGGQALAAVEVLRREGADVRAVLCVVDRQQGAAERLRALGIPFRALFTLAELKSYADLTSEESGRES